MEADHIVTGECLLAVSLSMVYLTMTIKKTFMAIKITTEPAEICGGSMPLKERKKIFNDIFLSFFWGSLLDSTRPELAGKNSLSPIASLCEDSQVSYWLNCSL